MNKRNSIIIINSIAFIFIYGAILGINIYASSYDLFTLWACMALVGGILNIIKYVRLKIKEIKILVKLIVVDTIGIICVLVLTPFFVGLFSGFFGGFFDDPTNDSISLFVIVLISIPILIYNRKIILANTDAE